MPLKPLLTKICIVGFAAVAAYSTTKPALAELIGLYSFENGSAANSVSGPSALPDLTVSGVTIQDGFAIFDQRSDFLELPDQLGFTPFTIYLDAAYDSSGEQTLFAVSQQSATSNSSEDTDFVIRSFPGNSNQVTFYNAAGTNISVNNGVIDGARHRIAITYDGVSLGNYFDGTLQTRSLFGTFPDLDGNEVRFGDRSFAGQDGATGLLYEIRIYDRALSEDELRAISPIQVSIDVKPGSSPNPINPRSKGVTPVAILGSEDFDVYEVNLASLTISTEGIKTVGSVKRKQRNNGFLCSYEDVSGEFDIDPKGTWDGYLDLVCKFNMVSIVPESGETKATLYGELNNGATIVGSDFVKIVP